LRIKRLSEHVGAEISGVNLAAQARHKGKKVPARRKSTS
jgi:hypothetical protein